MLLTGVSRAAGPFCPFLLILNSRNDRILEAPQLATRKASKRGAKALECNQPTLQRIT